MTPSNKTRSCVLIALAMLIMLISTLAHAQTPRKVKMTLPVVALTTAPVYLAEAKGYFAQEGLSVELNVTGGGGPDIKALIAGDVDFTYTASDQVILPWQEGKRLVMVMGVIPRALINWAMHKDVAQAKGITEKSPLADKLKALRGLTIGSTQPGSLTANLAAYTLRKAGLVPQQDANVIPVGSGLTWLAALEQRKVDVALMSPPLPDTAVARGFAILLIDNARGEDPALAEFLQQVLGIERRQPASRLGHHDQDRRQKRWPALGQRIESGIQRRRLRRHQGKQQRQPARLASWQRLLRNSPFVHSVAMRLHQLHPWRHHARPR
jgi:ABC-type nitrate/sulfonate/bicarbonate transport system substrate-binding protein